MNALCSWFWGSHGCDLEPDHTGSHICGAGSPDGPCSYAVQLAGPPAYNEFDTLLWPALVTYIYTDGSGQSAPMPNHLFR